MTPRLLMLLAVSIYLPASTAHSQQGSAKPSRDETELRLLAEVLTKKEAKIVEDIEANEANRIRHNGNKPDATNLEAVRKYNEIAEAGRAERERLDKNLADVGKRKADVAVELGRAFDRYHLAWLTARVKKLDGEIADLDARVKRTEALLQ